MKEDELRQYATCAICKQPVGYSGLPMLWKLTVERRMCEALGIDPPPVMVETPACPDCGSVHNGGRCNGRPVTVRLVRQRTPPPAWVREATRNLEALRGKE